MNKLALIAILALSLTACSNASDATKALTAQGFTDIQITGYAGPFACSEDDFYSTGFIATNPQGKRVEGVACSGFFFKSTTIRW